MAARSNALVPPGDTDRREFLLALEERRRAVYDYLDAWPGTAAFKPDDIHEAIHSYIGRRGKALRPLLLLLACGAAGGAEEIAIPAAAAVEVFHTWTLVHDDIIDRDDTRRGHPTVHARYREHGITEHGLDAATAAHYGQAVAILTGDMQQSWAFALLVALRERGVAPGLVLELIERMASWLTPQLLEGEMLDVQYSLTDFAALSDDQVLDMLTKKTASLLEYAAWAGAMLGSGGTPEGRTLAGDLGRFAGLCGTAFQLHDDLLGLTANEAALGKPVGSDIREGKRTLVVFRSLEQLTGADRAQVLGTLGNASASAEDVEKTLSILKASGALDDVSALANSLIDQALSILERVPESRYRMLLNSWAAFLLARTY